MPLPGQKGVVSEDLLDALLRTALAEETALDARRLRPFAEALRARAARILAERVQPIEERAAAFEKESAWRAGIIASLEAEKEALRREGRTTAEAHDRLLAHHRATLRRLAEALEPLPAALPWSYRLVRARLLELLESLRKEAP
jgi:hypothetical protein